MTTETEKTNSRNEQIGEAVIRLLNLKVKDGRVNTSWGNKTVIGLGASIDRIVSECLPDQSTELTYDVFFGIHEKAVNEFTGIAKKDFAVKCEKNRKGELSEVRITFDRPDGVSPREMFEAMKTLSQVKLMEALEVRNYGSLGDFAGFARICVRGGMQLCTVKKAEYMAYLASDENVIAEENKSFQNSEI